MVGKSKYMQTEEKRKFLRRVFRYTIIPVFVIGILLTMVLHALFRDTVIRQITRTELERIAGIEASLREAHLSVQEIGLRYLSMLRSTSDLSETDRDNLFLTLLTAQERTYVDSIYLYNVYEPDEGFTVVKPNSGWTRTAIHISEDQMRRADPEALDMVRNYDQYYPHAPITRLINGETEVSEVYTYVLPMYSLMRTRYNSLLIINMSRNWLDQLLVLPGGEAYLLDQSDSLLSTNTDVAFQTPLYEMLSMKKIEVIEGAHGFVVGSYKGESAIFIYARLNWIDWKVVDVVLVDDVCPDLNRMLVVSLAAFLITMFAGMGIDWLLSRRMIKPLNAVFSRLSDMENWMRDNDYMLKQNYLNAMCQDLIPAEEEGMTSDTFKALHIKLKPNAPFRMIGVGLEGQTVANVRERLLEIADTCYGEIYELNDVDAILITQCAQDTFEQTQKALARFAAKWVVSSTGECARLSMLPHAVQDMTKRLAYLRFWDFSDNATGVHGPYEENTAKLAALEKQLSCAVRQRDGTTAKRIMSEILTLGKKYEYMLFRKFLVHIALEVSFALNWQPVWVRAERMRLAQMVDNRFLQSVSEMHTANEIKALFESLFQNLSSDSLRGDHVQIVKMVCEQIQTEYNNANLTIGDIAQSFRLTGAYLGKLFQSYTGQTYTSYLTNVRIAAARDMLVTTNKPVESVAVEVGYLNTKYFYSIFKKRVGITPREYRVRFTKHP